MITRPMLAAKLESADFASLTYPMLASPKLDGIRVLLHPTLGPVTRKFKPVPNVFTRNQLSKLPHYLDGEILVLNAGQAYYTFNGIQSAIMSRDGEPTFTFAVFDCFMNIHQGFAYRLKQARGLTKNLPGCFWLPHVVVKNADDLTELHAKHMAAGYEGTMLRFPTGPYKNGRSTLREGFLLKIKDFDTAEGTISAIEPRQRNDNPAVVDLLGYTKRSSHQANKVTLDTLGKFVVNTLWGELRVGTGEGLDNSLRQWMWDNRASLIGKTIEFKYQAHGTQELPRGPIFLRMRSD